MKHEGNHYCQIVNKNKYFLFSLEIPELSQLHKYVPDLGDDDVFMVSL